MKIVSTVQLHEIRQDKTISLLPCEAVIYCEKKLDVPGQHSTTDLKTEVSVLQTIVKIQTISGLAKR